MPKNSRVLIIADAEHLAAVHNDRAMDVLSGMACVAMGCDARIPSELLSNTSLLVIEVAPDNPGSMERLVEIRRDRPDLVVLAAIMGADLKLVRGLIREGVADVVPLPFDTRELLPIILDALARGDPAKGHAVTLAPVIAVARSLGGCGATTVATHLAADLAFHDPSGRGAVILDLDLQFGSVADYLGVTTSVGVDSLLAAGDRLDDELIRSVAAKAGDGVWVISAPEVIMPLEAVDSDRLINLIQLLRRDFAYVILDLPADWTNWTLSTAIAADVILLIVELSVGSLRQAKRRLELFRSVGIKDKAVQIVVNRVEKRLFRTIDLSDVTDTLGTSVLGSLALEHPQISSAQDQGQLVSRVHRKSAFSADIARIGEALRLGHLAERR